MRGSLKSSSMVLEKYMSLTDIYTKGFIQRLPENWRPYALLMRLDRPIGWWLLLLPGWWSIVLHADGLDGRDVYLMALFLIGAIIMRGAGCVINDIWDRDLDKQVGRTSIRPLAEGRVNLTQTFTFLSVL